MDHISRLCFGASYGVALVTELAQAYWPSKAWRWASLLFGTAGLLAHSIFLLLKRPTLAMPYGSLLLLAWILAVFYLYGSVHHRRLAWAIFVLPVVLGLVILAGQFAPGEPTAPPGWLTALTGQRFWGTLHGTLVLLAGVGVCVGAIASVMYLVQTHRLRMKSPGAGGFRLLSLERLEAMNRRAINAAFPMLTVGLLVGAALGYQMLGSTGPWMTPKVLGTVGLWLANAVLLILRYSWHARGRLLALGTLGAFVILLVALATVHPFVGGGEP